MEEVFAGVDWGCGSHAVCVLDAKGAVLDRFEARHDREGLAALTVRLRRHGAPRVAIERPTGLLIDHLVEAGLVVVPIHPNAVKACRPRYRAVSAKSDPGAAAVFADVASPIALAFLDRYPTPDSARRLGPARMAGFLAQRRYCGRRSPEALLERLRAAPTGHAGEAERKAKGEMVRALARTLHGLVEQLGQLTRRIEHTVASLPDGRLVMSPNQVRGRLFPRAGRVCAAQILGQLGDVRGRFQTNDQLAAEAGVTR